MNFLSLLAKYRKDAFNERDKGDKFERLMQRYLLSTPEYSSKIKEVWMWNDFFGKQDFGGKDVGIDLVAKTHSGDFWAIQCKCYQESATIDKPAVDSFLSTSSRSFRNEHLQDTKFAQRVWISTTNNWGTNADEAIKNQDIPVFKINLTDLSNAAVPLLKG